MDAKRDVIGEGVLFFANNGGAITAGQDVSIESEKVTKYIKEKGWTVTGNVSLGGMLTNTDTINAAVRGGDVVGAMAGSNPTFGAIYGLSKMDSPTDFTPLINGGIRAASIANAYGQDLAIQQGAPLLGNNFENTKNALSSGPSVSIGVGTHKSEPLINSNALKDEGVRLDHCVGGYARKCLFGNSHIISLRRADGSSVSTVELQLCKGDNPAEIAVPGQEGYYLQVIQHYGLKNNTPPQEAKEAVNAWIADISAGKIKIDFAALDAAHKEREGELWNEASLLLIGYDHKDPTQCKQAQEIYGKFLHKVSRSIETNFNAAIGNTRTYAAQVALPLLEAGPAR